MKLRHGFVSNSSSSSYCIVGGDISLSKDLIDTLLENINGVPVADIDEYTFCEMGRDVLRTVYDELSDKLNEIYNPLGMTVLDYPDAEIFFVGFNLEDPQHHTKSINTLKQTATEIFKALPIGVAPVYASLEVGEIHT